MLMLQNIAFANNVVGKIDRIILARRARETTILGVTFNVRRTLCAMRKVFFFLSLGFFEGRGGQNLFGLCSWERSVIHTDCSQNKGN